MFDCCNRRIHYLRVSVTDRCNLRCTYCMPAEGVACIPHERVLTYEEIRDVVAAGVALGIDTVRLTGGEPLVRRHLHRLVAMLAALPGISDLALTTNAQLLAEQAAGLAAAGLRRVNISLDSVDAARYRAITRGGDLARVFAGIAAARAAGLAPIKLNCVVERDGDEPDARQVAAWARAEDLELRFIPRMEVETGRFARVLGGHGGDCARCNRLRLTSDGFLLPCLFSDLRFDVRALGAEAAFRAAVAGKPVSGTQSVRNRLHAVGG